VAAWVRLDDRATGRGFYVFNTHWDHRNQPSREKAAELIVRRIEGRKHKDQPVVLLGDFNAVLDNPAVRTLAAAGLADAWHKLHSADRDITTLHFWEGSRRGRRKVDHILVSGGAEVVSAGIRDRDEPMISDHFPVTARVRFR
ncbi:MAG: endonuclease/exonuclease/phosphatase family protein, partial [Verrucomicrobiae bacterium]|nr:endonuclease/exonuclease/phosphatase family protein [Verrucomicrobiae bacterium]